MTKARRQGHPSVFTPAQNKALHQALRKVRDTNAWSQAQVGAALGVAQQVAGKLLRREGGFSYQTATRLVRLLHHDGVDAFFADQGVETIATAATGTEG